MAALRKEWQDMKAPLKGRKDWESVISAKLDLGPKLDKLDKTQDEIVEKGRDIGKAVLKVEDLAKALLAKKTAYEKRLEQVRNVEWDRRILEAGIHGAILVLEEELENFRLCMDTIEKGIKLLKE